jgi:hypothetical protein
MLIRRVAITLSPSAAGNAQGMFNPTTPSPVTVGATSTFWVTVHPSSTTGVVAGSAGGSGGSGGEGNGYSVSDRINLGVGIGVGLPATLAGLYLCWAHILGRLRRLVAE